MSDARPRVAVLFGGRSTEHEISCLSAGNVLASLTASGYDVVPIGISADGRWLLVDERQRYQPIDGALPAVTDGDPVALSLAPAEPGLVAEDGRRVAVDVVFPVLHGPYGEDGTIQGLLEIAGLPYVGAGVFSSAAAMDKEHMKAHLRVGGLPVGDYVVLRPGVELTAEQRERLGLPVFVKPARGGSSIGINRVDDWAELPAALDAARACDPKVLVEAAVVGREVECGVLEGLDGARPQASVPAEVRVSSGAAFYDFTAKYVSDNTEFDVPAQLPVEVTARVQELAVAAFDALDCAGLARVDVFVCSDGRVLVNELNTMPGFTAASMFPRMWAASGVDGPALADRLVRAALARGVGLR